MLGAMSMMMIMFQIYLSFSVIVHAKSKTHIHQGFLKQPSLLKSPQSQNAHQVFFLAAFIAVPAPSDDEGVLDV